MQILIVNDSIMQTDYKMWKNSAVFHFRKHSFEFDV